jgi:pyroglutamyl-peptidase
VRGGFIHVPFLPAQATHGQPSVPLATMVAALRIAMEVSLKTRRDVHATGGREH